jgi:hypothetical protein
MNVRFRAQRLALTIALLATASFAVAACSEDSTGPELTIVGTWNVTSFEIGGTDAIAGGMVMTMTFTGSKTSGTYSIQITNDLLELCDNQQPSCNPTGDYTATDTQVTFDPDGDDATVFNITFQGSSMTWNGEIDQQQVTVTLARP